MEKESGEKKENRDQGRDSVLFLPHVQKFNLIREDIEIRSVLSSDRCGLAIVTRQCPG